MHETVEQLPEQKSKYEAPRPALAGWQLYVRKKISIAKRRFKT